MAITYPLIIPGSIAQPPGTFFPGTSILVPNPPGPAKAHLQKFDKVGETIGEFDGIAQQQQWQDQHWLLDLEWPEMTWQQFSGIDAFAGALHGKVGSFLWGPPWASSPQGSGLLAGTPVATGADASLSNLLHTNAWLPNQSGLLLPGDFFSLLPQSFPFTSYNNQAGVALLGAYGTLPAWAVVGASIWITGTGLFDGGPFVLTYANQITIPVPTWAITFNSPAVVAGVGAAPAGSAVLSGPFPRLYEYVSPSPLSSDGGGNATLDIFPCLREAPPAGSALALVNPQGTFRLSQNLRGAPAGPKKTFSFQMKCREAI